MILSAIFQGFKINYTIVGEEWRDMRATLSPAFTTTKIKQMFGVMLESAQRFTKHFLDRKDDVVVVVEMKDCFTRFTNDVIATTAFGIGCDSLKTRNNEFYLVGEQMISFLKIWWKQLILVGYILIPRVLIVSKV